jgi:S1-C subfamily serine protease
VEYKVKVIAESSDDDLAVLQTIDAAPSIPATVAVNSAEPQLGEKVFTVGFPDPDVLGNNAKFTEGSVSGLSVNTNRLLQISVPVQPGNSGGALVNEKGEAIGVIVSRMKDLSEFENVAFAINGAALHGFLRGFQTTKVPRTKTRTAAIGRAEAAACRVIAVKPQTAD